MRLTLASASDLKNAVWGGLMSAGAQSRGARGVVISGRCRDLSEHRTANFPVFARGHSTVGSGPFARCTSVQVPIEIKPIQFGRATEVVGRSTKEEEADSYAPEGGFPGVAVRPGDWILADSDGVVCVPRELVDKVKEFSAIGRAADAHILEDIRADKGVAASFKKWRG